MAQQRTESYLFLPPSHRCWGIRDWDWKTKLYGVLAACVTVVGAIIGALKFIVSRKKTEQLKSVVPEKMTKREMIEIIKDDIRILISSVQGRNIWQKNCLYLSKVSGEW